MMKKLFKKDENSENMTEEYKAHRLKAHKIGDIALTVTTVVFVIVSLCFNMQFAPFIVLLMSSRIGTSIYTIIKTSSKMEVRKLIVWSALFLKSAFSCFQFFAFTA